jgi:hypothetical protein
MKRKKSGDGQADFANVKGYNEVFSYEYEKWKI